MKLSFTPVAAAVAVAIASTSAHAALSTTLGTAAPGLDGLYVSIWDTSSHNSELVNLGNNYAAVTAAGALTPDTATSPYVTAANPAGTGSVLQIDFGVLPSFSATFGTPGATTDYMVLAASGQTGAVVTNASTAQMQTLTASSMVNLTGGITGQASNWAAQLPNAGVAIDTTGSANYNALVGPNAGGSLGLAGFNFSGAVGSALNFYNIVKTGRSTVSLTQYANSTGNGFWFLSSSGDLTWNVPTSGGVSTVPLPAAVWLFASSLAGLGAIGRRRLAAAA